MFQEFQGTGLSIPLPIFRKAHRWSVSEVNTITANHQISQGHVKNFRLIPLCMTLHQVHLTWKFACQRHVKISGASHSALIQSKVNFSWKFALFFKFTIWFYILTGIKVIMLACQVLYWLVLGSMAKTMSTMKSTICCTYKTTLEGCMKNMFFIFNFLSSCGDCLIFFMQFFNQGDGFFPGTDMETKNIEMGS